MADHKASNKRITIYLAGKITGDPDYQRKFARAAEILERVAGCVVLSPAILPSEGFTYPAYLRMSEAMLRECDAICMLPGWEDSPGAVRELDIAKEMGLMVVYLSQKTLEGRCVALCAETDTL